MLYLGMAVTAALAFTVGGIFMKLSQGFTQPIPSLVVIGLFAIGAAITALAIHVRGELGPAYLIVLGLEAVLAFVFGAALFGEHANLGRVLGLALLVVGMILLEGCASSPQESVRADGVVGSRSA